GLVVQGVVGVQQPAVGVVRGPAVLDVDRVAAVPVGQLLGPRRVALADTGTEGLRAVVPGTHVGQHVGGAVGRGGAVDPGALHLGDVGQQQRARVGGVCRAGTPVVGGGRGVAGVVGHHDPPGRVGGTGVVVERV